MPGAPPTAATSLASAAAGAGGLCGRQCVPRGCPAADAAGATEPRPVAGGATDVTWWSQGVQAELKWNWVGWLQNVSNMMSNTKVEGRSSGKFSRYTVNSTNLNKFNFTFPQALRLKPGQLCLSIDLGHPGHSRWEKNYIKLIFLHLSRIQDSSSQGWPLLRASPGNWHRKTCCERWGNGFQHRAGNRLTGCRNSGAPCWPGWQKDAWRGSPDWRSHTLERCHYVQYVDMFKV